MRPAQTLSALLGLAFAAAVATAAPVDDHQAGLDAYRNGDVRNAISVLRKAADAGHGPSQALLGEILDLAEHNEEAVKYFRLAADQGLAEGFYGLGVMHATGEGVARDLVAARRWITKAAEAGHKQAVNSLAQAYILGGLGIEAGERSSPEALKWASLAAAGDSLAAIDWLAIAYRNGERGLAADVKKAEELEERSRALRKIAPRKPAKKTAVRPPNV